MIDWSKIEYLAAKVAAEMRDGLKSEIMYRLYEDRMAHSLIDDRKTQFDQAVSIHNSDKSRTKRLLEAGTVWFLDEVFGLGACTPQYKIPGTGSTVDVALLNLASDIYAGCKASLKERWRQFGAERTDAEWYSKQNGRNFHYFGLSGLQKLGPKAESEFARWAHFSYHCVQRKESWVSMVRIIAAMER